jgi:hypothetical protein
MIKELSAIAEQVIQGDSKAAFVLPDRYAVRLHILLARKLKALKTKDYKKTFSPLFKYFQGLSRYHQGIMWKIFLSINGRDRASLWYHDRESHIEMICNALFCAKYLSNGKWRPIHQTEEGYWARCQSLHDVLYGKVQRQTYAI